MCRLGGRSGIVHNAGLSWGLDRRGRLVLGGSKLNCSLDQSMGWCDSGVVGRQVKMEEFFGGDKI